jgi:hypothetical protein
VPLPPWQPPLSPQPRSTEEKIELVLLLLLALP